MSYNSDLLKIYPNATGINGEILKPSETLNPCGLISVNYFSDYFQLKKKDNDDIIEINMKEITHQIDRNYFKRNTNQNEVQWKDVEDERFIAWMYMETFSSFRKKWGKLNSNLEAGEYKLLVNNNWNSLNFETKKNFVIMSDVEFTSKSFYGYTLIVAGLVYLIAIGILIFTKHKQKKIFNPNDLKWE